MVANFTYFYLTQSWGEKGVYSFPKGISPKVNVIEQLEFKFPYFDVTILHIDHYIMGLSKQ